jgi:hypothetical protein
LSVLPCVFSCVVDRVPEAVDRFLHAVDEAAFGQTRLGRRECSSITPAIVVLMPDA